MTPHRRPEGGWATSDVEAATTKGKAKARPSAKVTGDIQVAICVCLVKPDRDQPLLDEILASGPFSPMKKPDRDQNCPTSC